MEINITKIAHPENLYSEGNLKVDKLYWVLLGLNSRITTQVLSFYGKA